MRPFRVPKKSLFGRFDDQSVQQRLTALENYMNKIANHPVCAKIRLFLGSDTLSLGVRVFRDSPQRMLAKVRTDQIS